MALNGCAECLKKQRELDRLTEELQRLKQTVRYQERQGMGWVFGSSTPSAKPGRRVYPNRSSASPGSLAV
jgi:hypothetical protein